MIAAPTRAARRAVVAWRHGGARSPARGRGRAHAGALRRALMGNHDYGATGWPSRPLRRAGLARRALDRARPRAAGRRRDRVAALAEPAARRGDVQCWHGGPQNAVHSTSARRTRRLPRAPAGERRPGGPLAAAAAWLQTPGGTKRVPVRVGGRSISPPGRWLLTRARWTTGSPPRRGCWVRLDVGRRRGHVPPQLDVERRTATHRRYDPAPARERARALGLAGSRSLQRPTRLLRARPSTCCSGAGRRSRIDPTVTLLGAPSTAAPLRRLRAR